MAAIGGVEVVPRASSRRVPAAGAAVGDRRGTEARWRGQLLPGGPRVLREAQIIGRGLLFFLALSPKCVCCFEPLCDHLLSWCMPFCGRWCPSPSLLPSVLFPSSPDDVLSGFDDLASYCIGRAGGRFCLCASC